MGRRRPQQNSPNGPKVPTRNPNVPPPAALPAVLLEFRHGLGDLVQLSIVLKHVCRHLPSVPIDVVCDPSKVLSRTRYERQRFGFRDPAIRRDQYTQILSLDFSECADDCDFAPSTKSLRCITEVFRFQPDPELFTYQMECSELARLRAAKYLAEVSGSLPNAAGKFPLVLIHYQGFSSRMQKDLPHDSIAVVASEIRRLKRAVAIFDIDRQSPVVDHKTVFAPVKGHPVWQNSSYADPETMLAMIGQAELFIGIDSGPLHLAGCTDTPSLGVWTHHHPTRFFDRAANVEHLVPSTHKRLAPGPRALAYFEREYRHIVYGDLTRALVEQLARLLPSGSSAGEPQSAVLKGLTATSYDERYYTEHLIAGLDYLGHGEWQRAYGRWLARALQWTGRRVLDVGCACGSILRGLGEAGMVVQGFDLSEYMIARGREKWPDMAALLHVCDAANLHLWSDGSWEGLHSNQVAEHWRPEMVGTILAELRRVTTPGGLFFCVLDTSELFERTGRDPTQEDPTHICIKPITWWHEQLAATGWELATEEFRAPLQHTDESFLRHYDWDWFVARNPDVKGA